MVRGAATNGDFAHCRDHGRHNDRRGGKWRTRHAAPGIKTSCRTTARKGFDIAEGGAVAVRGRGGGGGAWKLSQSACKEKVWAIKGPRGRACVDVRRREG